MASVAEWKLNDNAGNSSWLDSSGNGNHLAGDSNPTSATGHGGTVAAAVDLSSAILYIAEVSQIGLDLSTACILSARIKIFDSTQIGYIISNSYFENFSYLLTYENSGTNLFKIRFQCSTNGNTFDFDLYNDTNLNINTWYHICVVWDGIDIRIYVNAILDCTPLAFTGTLFNSNGGYIIIGGTGVVDNLTSGYSGILDDVRIYDNATDITPAELYALGDDFAAAVVPAAPSEDNSRTKTKQWDSVHTTTEANYRARELMFGGKRGRR